MRTEKKHPSRIVVKRITYSGTVAKNVKKKQVQLVTEEKEPNWKGGVMMRRWKKYAQDNLR